MQFVSVYLSFKQLISLSLANVVYIYPESTSRPCFLVFTLKESISEDHVCMYWMEYKKNVSKSLRSIRMKNVLFTVHISSAGAEGSCYPGSWNVMPPVFYNGLLWDQRFSVFSKKWFSRVSSGSLIQRQWVPNTGSMNNVLSA